MLDLHSYEQTNDALDVIRFISDQIQTDYNGEPKATDVSGRWANDTSSKEAAKNNKAIIGQGQVFGLKRSDNDFCRVKVLTQLSKKKKKRNYEGKTREKEYFTKQSSILSFFSLFALNIILSRSLKWPHGYLGVEFWDKKVPQMAI